MPKYKNTTDILIMAMTIAMVVTSVFAMYHTGYQSGFNTAKSLIENSSLGAALRTPDDNRTLFSTVTAVNGSRITLRTTSNSPFDDPALIDRIVVVTPSTKIIKFVLKDIKVFQDELTAYTKAMESDSTSKSTQPLTPPVLAVPIVADLASITVGNTLMVTALTNIKAVKEFTASEIQIQLLAPPVLP